MPITYFKLGRQGQLLFNASCTSFRDFILFWSSPTWTTDLFLQNWPTWDYSVHQKDLLQFRRAIPEAAIYSKVCNAAEVCWDWMRQGLNEESSPGILKVSKRVAHTPCVPHSVWWGLKKMLNMFSLREVITIIWWLFIKESYLSKKFHVGSFWGTSTDRSTYSNGDNEDQVQALPNIMNLPLIHQLRRTVLQVQYFHS